MRCLHLLCLGLVFLLVMYMPAGTEGAGKNAAEWSVQIQTAAGEPQDVWIAGRGHNDDGWRGGGSICLGLLAQGFEVGDHVLLLTDLVEGGVIGEDGTPVPAGDYVAPSDELGDQEFTIDEDGGTFYVIVDTEVMNSNVEGFEVGDPGQLMFTFDFVEGRTDQCFVLWFGGEDNWFPFLNEGVMMANVKFHD